MMIIRVYISLLVLIRNICRKDFRGENFSSIENKTRMNNICDGNEFVNDDRINGCHDGMCPLSYELYF